MEKKINNILRFTTKDGEENIFHVLFTFHSERFDKDYVVFYNEKDEYDILAFSFTSDNELQMIQSEEEYEEVDEALCAYEKEENANNE